MGGVFLPWLLQGLVAGLWGFPGWCWGPTARLSPQAAARHRCSYLVGLHREEFLQVGGNPAWLQGLHCAPQKLRNLSEINKLLAHRPWLVTKEHIEVRADTASADSLPTNPKPDTPPCADPRGFTRSGLRASQGLSELGCRVCAGPDGWGRDDLTPLWRGTILPAHPKHPLVSLPLVHPSCGVQSGSLGGLSSPVCSAGSAEDRGGQLVAGRAGASPGAPHPLPLTRLLRLRLRHPPQGGPGRGAWLPAPFAPQQQQLGL